MKLLKRITAFFLKNEEPVELDLTAAVIREGRAFLHVRGKKTAYMVKSNDIRILLNSDQSLTEADVIAIDEPAKDNKEKLPKETAGKKKDRKTATADGNGPALDESPFKKRTVSFSLYPDEYDALMLSLKEYGYKKADFLLACVETATPGTMERAHKRIVKNHQQILQAKKAFQQAQKTETEN